MDQREAFSQLIGEAYTFKGPSLTLGAAILDGKAITGALVKAPLKTMNRHGLIAGATGTGKTKTLQVMAEGLSDAGVPVLLMDIKGDLSGLAKASAGHPKIDERHAAIGTPHKPSGYTIEPLTISEDMGVRMRATVSEFGPVLLSKMLGLNDTQSGILAMIFKFCDDRKMPLLDLKDLKKILQHVMDEGKEEIEKEYGRISTASIGTINRKIIELEQQGAEEFFGEKSFDTADLLRKDEQDRGIISILRLTEIQDRPKLFSTFMLCLLAEIYNTFGEQGDQDRPRLVIFIDEAHLIFKEASSALLSQLDAIVKLIRSKGVGLYFCTQVPSDIPENILSQLGFRVQHALRAFTARDRKKIKLVAENFPPSDYYDVDQQLTSLGIGEALITVLNEKGIPAPLAATLLVAPRSRMDILTPQELKEILTSSELADEYNERVDRESAYEMLQKKIEQAEEKAQEPATRRQREEEDSILEELSKNTMVRQLGRTLMRELTRGLLGTMGVSTRKKRRSSSLW